LEISNSGEIVLNARLMKAKFMTSFTALKARLVNMNEVLDLLAIAE
jgi:hypothetical protein